MTESKMVPSMSDHFGSSGSIEVGGGCGAPDRVAAATGRSAPKGFVALIEALPRPVAAARTGAAGAGGER